MVRVFITGFLCLLTQLSWAQDLKIDLKDIPFSSDLEKKSFESYAANNPDYFALLLSPDESVNADQLKKWKSNFEGELAALKSEVDAKKRMIKR